MESHEDVEPSAFGFVSIAALCTIGNQKLNYATLDDTISWLYYWLWMALTDILTWCELWSCVYWLLYLCILRRGVSDREHAKKDGRWTTRCRWKRTESTRYCAYCRCLSVCLSLSVGLHKYICDSILCMGICIWICLFISVSSSCSVLPASGSRGPHAAWQCARDLRRPDCLHRCD
jgi:hypothetical protein